MSDATIQPAQPTPVLDYAPPIPQSPLARLQKNVAWTAAFIVAGAILGYAIAPTTFTALGYFNLSTATPISPAAVVTAQNTEAARFLATAPAIAAAAHSSPTAPLTPADVTKHLRVKPIPESRLIQIAFDADDPKFAATVAQTMMTNYVTNNPALTIIAYPMTPTRPTVNNLYPLTGALTGLLLGLARIALRKPRMS